MTLPFDVIKTHRQIELGQVVLSKGKYQGQQPTVELQWLKHLCNHEIMFETGVVRANEC